MDNDIARLRVHEKFADLDIVDWMAGIVRPKKSESILDLGCGTGRQLLRFLKATGPGSVGVGVDLSRAGIAELSREVARLRLKNVSGKLGRIEEFDDFLSADQRFDICMSNFAIYYVKTLGETLRRVAFRLSSRGRFFVSGPACHNNYELIQLHANAVGADPEELLPHEMETDVLPAMKKTFPRVNSFIFRNPVRFPSAKSLIDYWRTYYLYTPEREGEFVRAATGHFRTEKEFVSVKEVLGVIGYKS